MLRLVVLNPSLCSKERAFKGTPGSERGFSSSKERERWSKERESIEVQRESVEVKRESVEGYAWLCWTFSLSRFTTALLLLYCCFTTQWRVHKKKSSALILSLLLDWFFTAQGRVHPRERVLCDAFVSRPASRALWRWQARHLAVYTAALLLLYWCFTALYHCFTTALQAELSDAHKRDMWRYILRLYYHFTTALLLLYRHTSLTRTRATKADCFTTALLLLYYCFTTALTGRVGLLASRRACWIRKTFTTALLLLYYCFNRQSGPSRAPKSLLNQQGCLYYCFTTALLLL